MRTRLLIGLAATAAGLAAIAGTGTAHAGGYSPGFSQNGILGPSGRVRYLAVSTQHTTEVKAVRVPSGKVLRSATFKGVFGVPAVAYDGTAGGVSRDGKTLVVSTFPGVTQSTRFLVVDTRTLAVRLAIRLAGIWSFDALSPDAATLYLIQFTQSQTGVHYLVRAYDVKARHLVQGAIADKSDPGPMSGLPVSRVVTADGTWAYTLYDKGNGHSGFIHALNTAAGFAICVDVELPSGTFSAGRVHLTLSRDEQRLAVRAADGTVLKTVPAPG